MTYKNRTDKKRLAILVWIAIPLLFFSLVQTKMQAYILFTCPALFMVTAEFYYWLYEARSNHKMKWINSIISILLIILPIRYTIERIKPFEIKERNPQWVVDLRPLNINTSEKVVLFNYNRPIEAMFYKELTVYPTIPDKKTIKKLQDKGYTILLQDDGAIPKEIQNINGVKLIKLSTQY